MAYSLQYYDLVLICIAVSLAAGALIGMVTSITSAVAVPALGLVAAAFVGHALFVNGPIDQTDDLTDEVELEEVPQVLSPLESSVE
ncbi:hypothetical protein ACFOZ7_12750 [Natribaculum luteum]|uniref:Uncharacterized protein n=1 Tax=Natribaculum luteum TaxID=1586232 RepID=A0ABD5P0M1_9EURY|nr:hypothetical protein [Natribaculum luteum]